MIDLTAFNYQSRSKKDNSKCRGELSQSETFLNTFPTPSPQSTKSTLASVYFFLMSYCVLFNQCNENAASFIKSTKNEKRSGF